MRLLRCNRRDRDVLRDPTRGFTIGRIARGQIFLKGRAFLGITLHPNRLRLYNLDCVLVSLASLNYISFF